MHNALGPYGKYAPGAFLKCTMPQEHVLICSCSILNLKYYPAYRAIIS